MAWRSAHDMAGVDLAGNAIFALLAVVLLVIAWRRSAVRVVTTTGEIRSAAAPADATISRDKLGDS